MDTKRLIATLIALGMVLATWALLTKPREIRGGVDQPVTLDLPEELGPYFGESLLFCQRDQCLSQFLESGVTDPSVCPRCGGALDTISLGEHLLLPSGTPIFRKRYLLAQTPPVDVTVVFSGRERRSIHRPQVCLTAQGQSIQNEIEVDLSRTGREPLTYRLLDLYHEQTLPDGRTVPHRGLYAYWFFNPEVETASHVDRLVRMAFDNIVRNYRPRWAYVIVSSPQVGENDRPRDRIETVIHLLEPLLQAKRAEMASSQPG